MRYGKIYYYDRLGNKVVDQEPVIKEEVHHFSINSPRIKVHANTPFDENRVIAGVNSLTDIDGGPMPGLTTQDLISFDRPSMPAELDDLNFGPVDSPNAYDRGYSIRGDREVQRSAYNQVFTPLNDLKDPDDPKNELARQMDKIDLNKLPTLGPYDSGYEDELCEDCRAVGQHTCAAETAHRTMRSGADSEDSSRLRFKLREHVDGINWDLMQKHRNRELLPMNVLPPFAHRPDEVDEKRLAQKERYRIEAEESKLRQAEIDRETSTPNLSVAQKYANEEEAQKAIELMNARKDAEFNRVQAIERRRKEREEENKVEWWETRNQFNEYKHDRDRKHYADQLRRNEALRHNVDQLQDFEEKFKQQREANHLMRYRQLEHVRDKVVEHPTELTRPEAARRQRELLESVWQSWAEAHRVNDRRYKVLQEFDARKHRPLQPALSVPASGGVHVECDVKRCRRCRRPIAKRVAFVN